MKTILDGACRYCGQIKQVEVPANSEMEVVIEAATMGCGCDAAKEYQVITKGKKKIDELFGEDFPEAAEVMKESVVPIVQGIIKNITVDTGWNVKGKISLKPKGLNIKREEKKERESNVK